MANLAYDEIKPGSWYRIKASGTFLKGIDPKRIQKDLFIVGEAIAKGDEQFPDRMPKPGTFWVLKPAFGHEMMETLKSIKMDVSKIRVIAPFHEFIEEIPAERVEEMTKDFGKQFPSFRLLLEAFGSPANNFDEIMKNIQARAAKIDADDKDGIIGVADITHMLTHHLGEVTAIMREAFAEAEKRIEYMRLNKGELLAKTFFNTLTPLLDLKTKISGEDEKEIGSVLAFDLFFDKMIDYIISHKVPK